MGRRNVSRGRFTAASGTIVSGVVMIARVLTIKALAKPTAFGSRQLSVSLWGREGSFTAGSPAVQSGHESFGERLGSRGQLHKAVRTPEGGEIPSAKQLGHGPGSTPIVHLDPYGNVERQRQGHGNGGTERHLFRRLEDLTHRGKERR